MSHLRVLGRGAAAPLLLAAALAAAGCGPAPEQGLYMTVERYLAAVMQRDPEGMALMWAPYRREIAGLVEEDQKKKYAAFQRMIRNANREFENAKKDGTLAPDPLGVALLRGLGIGKGAVSLPGEWSIAPDGATAAVRSRINTNLDAMNLNSLPDGVRVFLMGYPLGRMEMIAVGYDKLEERHLLGSVDVDWRLSRAPEGMRTPAGWLIESLSADPNSAVEWKPSRLTR